MKWLGCVVLGLVGLILITVDRSEAFPKGCYNCATKSGYPQEKCCNECPVCRYHFEVETPKDPGCRKLHRYHYDVEKVTGCHKETYDRLDATVEVPPEKGCKKSYHYHYDTEDPCDCHKETYDTYDFEVVAPKKEKKCQKVKLEAYADHPVRDCQCDCNMRRYVMLGNPGNRTLLNILHSSTSTELNESDRNQIRRMKRHVTDSFRMKLPVDAPEEGASKRQYLKHRRTSHEPPYPRRLRSGPRIKRKEKRGFLTTQGGFVCHCTPAEHGEQLVDENGEVVGAPRSFNNANREPAVYIGDSSNPITYDQIKRHMDALPTSEYSPTTNDIISNLTVLFYDIYQQKHKKNFTLPLKYGTRTVVEKGDGLQQYDIKPIQGEYQAPKLNRLASKGLKVLGRKIDRKTGQESPRRNRLPRRP